MSRDSLEKSLETKSGTSRDFCENLRCADKALEKLWMCLVLSFLRLKHRA